MTCGNRAQQAYGYQRNRDNLRACTDRASDDCASPLIRTGTMPLSSFFRSLLAAYACGASGCHTDR